MEANDFDPTGEFFVLYQCRYCKSGRSVSGVEFLADDEICPLHGYPVTDVAIYKHKNNSKKGKSNAK